MNRRKLMSGAVVGAVAAATARLGHAAESEIEVFAAHWRKSKDFTLKVADAMPAESYDYKPFAGARSFGGEMQHLAQAEGFYLARLAKTRPPAAPSGDTSKAATIKYLTAQFDWSIGVVSQLTSADLNRSFTGRGPSMTGIEMLYGAIVHTAHTRGYAEMFLRNKGITPPEYDI
ncbi:MAG TPA: DinB family protein [Bryobacteraceae bacterium]|nr:DinB family protein [Bryobacteraceae bacterium]